MAPLRRDRLALSLIAAASAAIVPTPSRSDVGRTTREHARSVEVTSGVSPVRSSPEGDAALLGTVIGGTRLAFGDEVAGEGCRGVFVALAQGGFACSRHLAYSSLEPNGTPLPRLRSTSLLPHRYVSTRRSGTSAYARPEDHATGVVQETYGRGFAFVSHGRVDHGGVAFERLARRTFVLAADVDRMHPSRFEGIEVTAGENLDHGFVLRDTPRLEAPLGRRLDELRRRTVVHVDAIEGEHARLRDGGYVALADLRRVTPSTRPAGVGDDELWIDVSIDEQTLVAYRGDRPVFATLVSTGADRAGRRTPLGEFRIESKFAEATMDDLGRPNPSEDYLVESVPWVQYFHEGVGFHAAFWHDDFGNRRSHGCVNLSPRDARHLYELTGPVVPAGWSSRYASESEPGTLVRVR